MPAASPIFSSKAGAMSRLIKIALTSLAALGAGLPALGASADAPLPIAASRIDDVARRAMQAFDVPGMAVGIVKDGRLVFARGYGVRELGKASPVTPDTVFQIGSNTKAFTAAALAILVDEGRIRWDDKVIDHLPQFRLADPYVTREFTLRDLLSHRSGLGLGAGDLMFYPATDFTRDEIMRGLRHLHPVSGFRAAYAYDNVLYMVAGQIIPAVTGQSWEDFVEQRLLRPLGMTECAASFPRLADRSRFAEPHTQVDGQLRQIPVEAISVIGAAGTINCDLNGLARWLETQLGTGQAAGLPRLYSAERGAEMWQANILEPVAPEIAAILHTHFKGYALGWEVQDEFGYERVSHTGGVPGTSTWISMLPELHAGVIVLTNAGNGLAMEAVGNQILDAFVGAPKRDLVAMLKEMGDDRSGATGAVLSEVAKTVANAPPPPLPLEAYAGHYADAWRGDVEVRREGTHLTLQFGRTERLRGELQPYSGNMFVVRWTDRSLDADAFVNFSQSFDGGIAGMTMRAISPATDFSFDFQDLDLVRTR
jgi:CubicO group peptidase (beta-lactamase class C family)